MDDHDLTDWSADDEGWRWWTCRCGAAEGPWPDDETAVDGFGSHVACTLVARVVRAENLNEVNRLRTAITAAIVDLNGAHYLNGPGDLCAVCGPADGSWPCVTRMVADDLRAALGEGW